MPDHYTSIGEAARTLGCAPSALRYYERRGLVHPATDRSGRRWYDSEQLRRVAFLRFGQGLGMSLERAGELLDGLTGAGSWRARIEEHIAALDGQIARAEAARRLLAEARDCPSERPFQECPHLRGALDAALDGGVTRIMTVADGAAEYAAAVLR